MVFMMWWGWGEGGDKATLIGQKYMTQETAAKNIKNQRSPALKT
jgi:hypothetical protein